VSLSWGVFPLMSRLFASVGARWESSIFGYCFSLFGLAVLETPVPESGPY
jgi:hypothetical protein